jgi:predicted nucleic-acid-binding Zn-ribbon protein
MKTETCSRCGNTDFKDQEMIVEGRDDYKGRFQLHICTHCGFTELYSLNFQTSVSGPQYY